MIRSIAEKLPTSNQSSDRLVKGEMKIHVLGRIDYLRLNLAQEDLSIMNRMALNKLNCS